MKARCANCGGQLKKGQLIAPAYSTVGTALHVNSVVWCERVETGWLGDKIPCDLLAVASYHCAGCGKVELIASHNVDGTPVTELANETKCLSCGDTIAAQEQCCSNCGWSWEQEETL